MASDILTPVLLLEAYRNGLFPMAEGRDETKLIWVNPEWRGVIPLNNFHLSRSLIRQLRKTNYEVRINHDFDSVVAGCANRPNTWINAEITRAYRQLFDLGHVHTLEIYDGPSMIGGVYGVSIGATFFGESMFSRQKNASKIALAYLVDRLRMARFELFDIQFLTPHLASLGAIEISRHDYKAALFNAVELVADFTGPPIPSSAQEMIQRNAQTS